MGSSGLPRVDGSPTRSCPHKAEAAADLVAEALKARCRLARARILLAVDREQAFGVAYNAFRDAARLGFDAASASLPWPVRGEPVLEYAFVRGWALGERYRAACAKDDEQRLLRQAEQLSREQERALARRERETNTPSAAEMLSMLAAGQRLELNWHTLEWHSGFDALMGTNAYGVDYLFGNLTLQTLQQWRTLMLDEADIGPVPHPHDEPHEQDDLFNENAYRVWRDFDDLLAFVGFDLDSDLQTLCWEGPHAAAAVVHMRERATQAAPGVPH